MRTTPHRLALVLAAGLIAGTAWAQGAQDARNATAPNEAPQGPSVVERAKSAGKRVAKGTRNLAHKGKDKLDQARRDDRADPAQAERSERSMGNRGSDARRRGTSGSGTPAASDTTRQQRMDDAYGNWQRGGTTTR